MTIKGKLYLTLSFLTLVIVLLGSMGSYYLVSLARDSEAIIKDNYRTLDYMQYIQQGLDEIQYRLILGEVSSYGEIREYVTLVETNLEAQWRNITEPGERQMSEELKNNYIKFVALLDNALMGDSTVGYEQLLPGIKDIKEQTRRIYLLNEESMLTKNERAKKTADQVVFYMALFGIIAFVIAWLFLVLFPPYISNPIRYLNEAIKEIARGNYKFRLKVNTVDEFGQLAISFNQMTAKLEQYENLNFEKLLFEKKRLDGVINQMQEATLGLSEEMKVIFANERMLGLIGCTKESLLGKYAPDLSVNNPLIQNLISGMMEGTENGQEPPESIKLIENNKQKMFLKHTVGVVDKSPGKGQVLMGHVIILNDVTEFVEKDIAKTHFMATLSHELKTPSAAIDMSLGLLRNSKVGVMNEEQRVLVKTIEENNRRIRNMINEVLDISKIESGVIDLKLEPVNPITLIEQAVNGVNLFLKEKQVKVTKSIAGRLPNVKADPHKTVWVLNNFLINAIRYSPEGETISVKGVKRGGGVVISVSDKGRGISPENLEKIFNRYNRIHHKAEGTGLGLAISKEFVEAMGGKIGVNSEPDRGSEFWISLQSYRED